MQAMLLQLTGISKFFPGVKALDSISFDLLPGEVHALCGENGAGKSTLMSILTGNLQADAGSIILNKKPAHITDPADAARKGIAIVYQHLSLVDSLSVAENIFANTQPRNKWGFIQYDLLHQRTQQLLESLHINYISPRKLVAELSPGEKQMVEIAKALSKDPDILILDEPTASIAETETRTLFGIIRKLTQANKSVVYISHRLPEIFQIADRVTVLKDGRYQGTHAIENLTQEKLIRLMVGREILNQPSKSFATGTELLRVTDLCGRGFSGISFSINKGEIVGLAGLIGAGRTEIAQTIFGYSPRYSGKIILGGKEISPEHPSEAIESGIGYVPEERKSQGLFLNKTVTENIVAAKLKAATSSGWYNDKIAVSTANSYKEKLRIATPTVQQQVLNLSGGNQQKVVLARWLLTDPGLLIVDEPTHGIDVGAKAEIYQLLRELAASGKAILIISSELPELLVLTDRIIVIRNGGISGFLDARKTSEEEILAMATG
jgi:ABC-type sugar transport system ATPase subunit